LSSYGNTEEIDKDFRRLAEKYKLIVPEANIDPDIYACAELKSNMLSFDPSDRNRTYYEFNETVATSPIKKFSAI
jgi:hypothetical protein